MLPPIVGIDSRLEELFFGQKNQWKCSINEMKNIIIGSNSRKTALVQSGVLPILLDHLNNDTVSSDVKLQFVIIIGSLIRGPSVENVQALVDSHMSLNILFKGLNSPDHIYVDACIRCLRTISSCRHEAGSTSIITLINPSTPTTPSTPCTSGTDDELKCVLFLMSIIDRSLTTKDCTLSILADYCKSEKEQLLLSHTGNLAWLLPIDKLCHSAFRLISALCYNNYDISYYISNCHTQIQKGFNGDTFAEVMSHYLARDRPRDIQIIAAKCLTNMFRSEALLPTDKIITHKVLATLIRQCHQDKLWEERVEAAETLSYLIEGDVNLQRLASISDHILTHLAEYFRYPGTPPNLALMPRNKDDILVGNELRQAAFKAFSSLGANDEAIRNRIIETDHLMYHVTNGLSDPVAKVQLAALRCLHSLSRSVPLLRTSFLEFSVWKPIIKILVSPSQEVLAIASSILCNILLDFSPSKEPMLENGIIDLLVNLTKRDDSSIRLNGIWALMNIAFKENSTIRTQILSSLGADQLFVLLCDKDKNVLLKTLGLLRNLLSSRSEIDEMMLLHGTKIIQAVVLILEGHHSPEVKEQALCILTSVADGTLSKAFIMQNDDILKKIIYYLNHKNTKLQIAATYCITNLSRLDLETEDAISRLVRLKELGVKLILEDLAQTSSDPIVYDKAKLALQQFCDI